MFRSVNILKNPVTSSNSSRTNRALIPEMTEHFFLEDNHYNIKIKGIKVNPFNGLLT
jgi:hypothetical protein